MCFINMVTLGIQTTIDKGPQRIQLASRLTKCFSLLARHVLVPAAVRPLNNIKDSKEVVKLQALRQGFLSDERNRLCSRAAFRRKFLALY